MFDLGGEIEGDSGMGFLQPAQNAKDMGRTVQEIRVPEGNMAGPHAHLLGYVGKHHVGRYGKKPAVVHRRDRAMQTGMEATPRGLGITGRQRLRTGVQLGVTFQSGQTASVRDQPGLAGKIWSGGWCGRRIGVRHGGITRAQSIHKVAERLFEFASDYRIGAVGQEIVCVQRGVESVVALVRVRIEVPDPARQVHPHPHGRMHGNRDADKPGTPDGIFRDRLDRGIDYGDFVSIGLQAGRRGSEAEGLMTQFIAGNEEDAIITFHDRTMWQCGRPGSFRLGRAVSRRHFGAFAKKELLQVPVVDFLAFGRGEIQAVLVYNHDRMVDPHLPGLFGNVVVDALAKLVGEWYEFETFEFFVELYALDHAGHAVPPRNGRHLG